MVWQCHYSERLTILILFGHIYHLMLSKFFKILFKVFLDTLSWQQLAVSVTVVFDNYGVGKLKIPTRNHKMNCKVTRACQTIRLLNQCKKAVLQFGMYRLFDIPDEKHAAYTHLLLIQFGSRICKRKGFLF